MAAPGSLSFVPERMRALAESVAECSLAISLMANNHRAIIQLPSIRRLHSFTAAWGAGCRYRSCSCRRFITVTEQYDGEKFFTLENGARVATPLLLVLAVIELSDIVFAVDSIPAVSFASVPIQHALSLCQSDELHRFAMTHAMFRFLMLLHLSIASFRSSSVCPLHTIHL